MGNNVKIQGFSFYIQTPIEIEGKPVKKSILNQFDLLGDIISLRRIEEENNTDYKQRIMDVSVHLGGPTYDGAINNITRDLGLSREHAILIELKLNSAGDPIATNPRVDILAQKVILYSDWRPDDTEIIDTDIRTYKTNDVGYFLENLVTAINNSTCFTATIYDDIRPNLHSSNLIMGSSDNIINGDLINANNYTKLAASYIIQDSLSFDENNIFQTEVVVEPTAIGEYMVDYINGKIYTYDTPSGQAGVYYHHAIFPLVVDYSPIRLYTLQDDNFVDELFQRETLDSGEEINGLPNTEGSETYHQLYTEMKVFWGE
jgi:hypothetical protein